MLQQQRAKKRARLASELLYALNEEVVKKDEEMQKALGGGGEEGSGWGVVHLCEDDCDEGEECELWGWPPVWCGEWVRSVLGRGNVKCRQECGFYHPTKQEVKGRFDLLEEARELADNIKINLPDFPGIEEFLSREPISYTLLTALAPDDFPQLLSKLTYTKPPLTHPPACPHFLVGMRCDLNCPSHQTTPKHLLPHCSADVRWHDTALCPYPHIMLPATAVVCKKFQNGVCPDRLLCTKKHTYV